MRKAAPAAAATLAAVLLGSATAPPALAQGASGPVIAPTRDVAVTYRVAGKGADAGELRVSWLAAERKMRLETPKMVCSQRASSA